MPRTLSAFCAGIASVCALAAFSASEAPGDRFRFEILGDRMGEAVPGAFERALHDASEDGPDFLVTVGDSIQGFRDNSAESEWKAFMALLAPYRRYPIYLIPGNHDVWSGQAAELYKRYAHRELNYSFDFHGAHFTMLNDHDEDARAPLAETAKAFLEQDLRTHADARPKFVFSHRPWWLFDALLQNESETQQLAEKYGVSYFIAGHLHEMLRFRVKNIDYLSMPSAGGHLRASHAYKDGWFFAHTLVEVQGGEATLTIKELGPPYGESRVTHPADWGSAGLAK